MARPYRRNPARHQLRYSHRFIESSATAPSRPFACFLTLPHYVLSQKDSSMSTEPFVSDVSITTGNSEHCSAPDTAQAPGCGCECPPTCPAKTEPKSTTGQSIRYSTGEISYRVNDLPSLTAGGIPWGHSRSFTPQLEFDQNVGQGWNWHVAHVPYLILRDTEVIVMGRGLAELWFDRDENTFAPRFGIKQQLTYNATTQNYTLRSVDGDLQIFDDEGLFLRQVDPAGNQLVVEALLTGTQLPASIKRVTGDVTEQYAYSYTSGGPAGSLLTEVVLRRKVGSGSWQNVASAIYTYYASGNPFGDTDDLQTVTTRTWQNSAWQDTGTTLYRYYLPQAASSGSSGAIPAQRGHLLRYVVKPSSFDRLAADPAVSDPLTAANSLVALYADYYFEFDEARRVTREVRSSGSQIFDYEYTTSSFSAAHNHWHTKTVETRPDGSRHVVFTNADGRVLLKSLETGVSPALEEWIDYYRYNSNGYVEFHAHPDAVIGYDEELADLVEYSPSTNTATYLYNNTGLIERYTYHAPTAWLTSESVQEGLAGTPRVVREMEYIPCCHGGTSSSSSSGSSSSGGGSSSSSEPCRYFLSQETLYRDENATSAAINTYDYTFYEGTCAIHERVTTLPLVSLLEHGSGVNNTRREVYDLYGRLTWSRDERGVITHFVYDELTGSLIQRIDDADTALLTGVPTALSSLWETLPQFGLHAITDFTVDPQGRTIQSLGPVHNIDLAGTATAVRTASWMLYDDANHTSYSAQGYVKTSDSSATLVNPISITIADSAGKTLVSAHATLSSTAGDLATCLSTHGPVTQADYTRLSTFQYTECCLAASQRAYHTIPTTGEGSPGTHYDQTSFGYDALKRRVRTVSPGGTISAVVLDPRGLTLSTYIGTNDTGATEQDPTGATAPGGSHPSNNMVLVSAAEYDIAGRLILSTQHVDSSTTRETSYSYDYRGRRLVTQGEENFCQKETYDFRGQLIRSERYDGSPTGTLLSRSETDYDALGRPYQSRRYAVNPSTGSVGAAMVDEVWYDKGGNVVQRTPANLALTESMTYDGLGRVLTITDARNAVTTLAYDIAGHQISLTDAEDNTTTWRYDGVGRVIEEENSLGKSRFYAYNTAGHLETRTDRNGRLIELIHDDLGRPDTELWKTGGSTVNTVSRTYDAEGRLQSISDDVSAYAYTYDLFGHIATVDNDGTDDVPHVLLMADWNRAGNRLSLAAQVDSSDDFTNSYLHNALGQPTQITQQGSVGGNSVTEKRVEFGYDVLNRPHAISRFEQVSGGTSLADSAFSFDDYGRIVQLKHAQSATILAQHDYTYDADRRLSSHETLDGTSAYDYDAIAQLTAADHPTPPDEAYNYDLTGNRTNTGYITGTNNQLLEDGTYEYLYDDEGNRIRKTDVATGNYTLYTWDHRNRLTKLTFHDSLSVKTREIEYIYDAHDRRIGKLLDSNGNGTFDDVWWFVYDSTTSIDLASIVLTYDNNGDLKNRNLHGQNVDQILAAEDDTGTIHWHLADQLGTIRDLIHYNSATTTTSLVNHLIYDGFGKIASQSNSTETPYYAFTGREWDQDAELYYYRARWYDAAVGRFISEDPISFNGKDSNLHRYVKNSPITNIDPFGLKWVPTGLYFCNGTLHGFIKLTDGKGYGYYAVSHIREATILETILTITAVTGVVLDTDARTYKDSPCYAIEVDDSCVDVSCYVQSVEKYVKNQAKEFGDPTTSKGVYNLLLSNCYEWRNNAVGITENTTGTRWYGADYNMCVKEGTGLACYFAATGGALRISNSKQ